MKSEPKDTVLFTVSVATTGEAAATPPILAISPETWKEKRFVTVNGKDDEYRDGNQNYEVEVRTLFTADPEYRDVGHSCSNGEHYDPTDRDLNQCPLGYYEETVV